MTGPLVLVGLAPSPRRPHAPPLDGPSGDRLARLAGLHGRRELLSVASAWNVSPVPSPTPAQVRMLGSGLLRTLVGRRVVLLGRDVAASCGVPWEPHYVWRRVTVRGGWVSGEDGHVDVATMPHPSGRCRSWNDGAQLEAARLFLMAAFAVADARSSSPSSDDLVTYREAAEHLGVTLGALRVRAHRRGAKTKRRGREALLRWGDVA